MKNSIIAFILCLMMLIPCVSDADGTFGLPLRQKWSTKLKKEKLITRRPYQYSTPAVTGEAIYAGTISGYMYGLNERTGKKLWETKLSSSVYSDPVVDETSVYVADAKGMVYALEKGTGKISWQVDAGAEVNSGPTLYGDTLYVVTAMKQLVAIDKQGRGKQWQTAKFGHIPKMTVKGSSAPVVYEGKMFVGYSDGTLVCYSPADGDIIWGKQLADKNARFTDIDSNPLIVNGVMYVSAMDGSTFALQPSDGSIIWSLDAGGANDLTYNDGLLYMSANGVIRAIEPSTGGVVWEKKLENQIETSSVAVKDGLAVVISTTDKLFVLDAKTGEVKFQRFLGRGSFGMPLIIDNMLYILTNSAHVHVFRGG